LEEHVSKYLAGLAALALMGAASLPLQANAAERQAGVSKQSTDMSAQRYWRHGYYRHRYWGPRYGYYRHRYWGPRYGYYGGPYYGYPYYRPGPVVSFGFGPFGFRAF
jgi:hypothetical protein